MLQNVYKVAQEVSPEFVVRQADFSQSSSFQAKVLRDLIASLRRQVVNISEVFSPFCIVSSLGLVGYNPCYNVSTVVFDVVVRKIYYRNTLVMFHFFRKCKETIPVNLTHVDSETI
jgi:hypothetical protein